MLLVVQDIIRRSLAIVALTLLLLGTNRKRLKLCFASALRCPRGRRETEFRGRRSQTEFGNEKTNTQHASLWGHAINGRRTGRSLLRQILFLVHFRVLVVDGELVFFAV